MKRLGISMSLILCISTFVLAQTVYITRTGSKYHSDGCRYLSRSCIPIALSEAKSEGYSPCSVCDPPVQVVKAHKKTKQTSSKKKQKKKQETNQN